jgi:hypothetical protein
MPMCNVIILEFFLHFSFLIFRHRSRSRGLSVISTISYSYINQFVRPSDISHFNPDYGGSMSSETSETQPISTRCQHPKAGATVFIVNYIITNKN